MQIRMNGDELKKLMCALSKDKSREILHCVHIERNGDNVEFTTTDGGSLMMFSRPISVYGDEVPEDFKISFDLTNFKINDKHIYHIIEEEGKLFFIGPDYKVEIMPNSLPFPNYHLLLGGFEKFPVAKDFTLFSERQLKILFKVFSTFDNLEPLTQGPKNPHFWRRSAGEAFWVVVLMPIRF